jgi:hypothetical protein
MSDWGRVMAARRGTPTPPNFPDGASWQKQRIESLHCGRNNDEISAAEDSDRMSINPMTSCGNRIGHTIDTRKLGKQKVLKVTSRNILVAPEWVRAPS